MRDLRRQSVTRLAWTFATVIVAVVAAGGVEQTVHDPGRFMRRPPGIGASPCPSGTNPATCVALTGRARK